MVNLPLEGKGDRLRWMRCIIRTNFLAYLTRSAIPAYGGHLISRLRRQLEVNCRVAAREATLGCLLKGKLNRYYNYRKNTHRHHQSRTK